MSEMADVTLDSLLATISQEQRDKIAKEISSKIRSELYPVRIEKMELVLTERCNFACHYCFLGNHGQGRDMSAEVAEEAIKYCLDRLPEGRDLCIVLFGGEPLMALPLIKHIVEFVKVTAKPGQKVMYDCTSNGSLITEEVAHYLAENGIKVLLSLDGKDEAHDLHRCFRDGSPTFNAVMAGFQNLRKYQSWVGARVTFSPETVHCLADDIIWLNQNGFCQFIIGIASGVEWPEEKLALIEPQMLKLAEYYRDIHVEGRLPLRITDFEDGLDALEKRHTGLWGCGAARSTVSVIPDGTIYPCSRFSSLFNCKGAYPCGNVKDGVANFAALHDLQDGRGLVRYPCYRCEYSNLCSGSCPAVNLEAMDSIYVTDPVSCAFVKVKIELHKQMPDLHRVHIDYPMMHAARAEHEAAMKAE